MHLGSPKDSSWVLKNSIILVIVITLTLLAVHCLASLALVGSTSQLTTKLTELKAIGTIKELVPQVIL